MCPLRLVLTLYFCSEHSTLSEHISLPPRADPSFNRAVVPVRANGSNIAQAEHMEYEPEHVVREKTSLSAIRGYATLQGSYSS